MEVAESIKAFVIEERLKPGDRLPNEAQLIEKYQMAKGTIREATRILEVKGARAEQELVQVEAVLSMMSQKIELWHS
ncbi:MAG: hypothetical protein CM15mP98_10300 [Paracoccaceae bacterium]|nr:MAG: hypothetical protein CM15mP98_10300 [Paracoccaceae bacterium]